MIERISQRTFDPSGLEEVERLVVESELTLRDALKEMPELVHYYVGIDREVGAVTNVSVWDTLGHARRWTSSSPCARSARSKEGVNGVFEAITNHEVLWSIIGAGGPTPA